MFDNASLKPVSDFRSLVTYDVTAEMIEAKKSAYAALEASTPKGYEEVRKARADCRTTRVAIEDRRKELKKVPLEMGKYIDSQAKELTALIESIEEPLALKLKAVDDEKDRIKREKEAAEKAALEAKIRAEREAEEARLKSIRDEEEKRLEEERHRLAEEAARLAEVKRQQDEAARIEREKQAAIQAEIDERNRVEREKIAAEKARIEAEQAAERERLAEESRKVQAAKEAAERAEFERQARIKAEAEAKAKAERDAREAEERRIAEAERKAAEERRLEAIRPDVEKLARFAQQLREIIPPNCNSESTQAVIVLATKRLAHTVGEIESFIASNKPAF